MSGHEEHKAATARWFGALAAAWAAMPPPDGREQLLARLGCPPGGTILDAGCGAGQRSLALADAGYVVVGVDLAPEMIDRARAAAAAAGWGGDRARYVVGDIERLDLADASVDAVICWNVLDFTPRPGLALEELRRVLRPGGRLLLWMLGAASPVKFGPGSERWRRFLPAPPAVLPLNDILPWEMAALLTALGWRIIEQRPRVGRTLRGPASELTQAQVEGLPTRQLRQAAYTSWEFVAERP